MELSEFQVNVGQACVEQVAYVIAGSLAVVADVEDLPDLGEGGPFPVWWTLVRFAVPDRVKGS